MHCHKENKGCESHCFRASRCGRGSGGHRCPFIKHHGALISGYVLACPYLRECCSQCPALSTSPKLGCACSSGQEQSFSKHCCASFPSYGSGCPYLRGHSGQCPFLGSAGLGSCVGSGAYGIGGGGGCYCSYGGGYVPALAPVCLCARSAMPRMCGCISAAGCHCTTGATCCGAVTCPCLTSSSQNKVSSESQGKLTCPASSTSTQTSSSGSSGKQMSIICPCSDDKENKGTVPCKPESCPCKGNPKSVLCKCKGDCGCCSEGSLPAGTLPSSSAGSSGKKESK